VRACFTISRLTKPKFQLNAFIVNRNKNTDDIPMALRTYAFDTQETKRRSFRLSKTLLLVLPLILGLAFFAMGSLRVFVFPSPVSGLSARLSSDGRLLGHFPYPEADPRTLIPVAPGLFLRPDAARSFIAMERAAASDGVALAPLSGFRSISVQNELFFDVKAERKQTSLERAQVSAPPGFSEHSTGYAIDIGDPSQPQTNLSLSFRYTKAYAWLMNNASRFQFVLSFPENNSQGVNFEPWHWRYEGSTEALRVFEPAQRLEQSSRRK
jgi:D-alanyl-D-alanine carboxypeptidase